MSALYVLMGDHPVAAGNKFARSGACLRDGWKLQWHVINQLHLLHNLYIKCLAKVCCVFCCITEERERKVCGLMHEFSLKSLFGTKWYGLYRKYYVFIGG